MNPRPNPKILRLGDSHEQIESTCPCISRLGEPSSPEREMQGEVIDEDIKDVPLIRWEPEFKSYTPASLGG